MSESTIVAIALVLFAWSVVSNLLRARNVSGPMFLLVSGVVLANPSWGVVDLDVGGPTIHHIAEITLGLLLFADASSAPTAAVRHDLPVTVRLLGIGLPLSILAGAALAVVLFPTLPLALAVVIAASLAPTDAALSATVFADERLPSRVRRVLNVESGLNDGIATPVVTAAIASAATALHTSGSDVEAGLHAVRDLALGVAIGGGITLVGGVVISSADDRGWMSHGTRKFATLALAIGAFYASSLAGGNPFVAAFIGGLVFGASAREQTKESIELTELGGTMLSLVIWFVFGGGFVTAAVQAIDTPTVVYAILSLTVIRLVPVALALVGSSVDRPTIAFIGWFGPRGLASVVFALLTVENLGGSDPRVVTAVNTIAITIVVSVVAHGATAGPFTAWYTGPRSRRGVTCP